MAATMVAKAKSLLLKPPTLAMGEGEFLLLACLASPHGHLREDA